MTVSTGFIVGVVVGVLLGAGIVIATQGKPHRYALTTELDLSTIDFLKPEQPSPGGTLKAGTEFTVAARKGNAAYVAFEAVLEHDKLMQLSREIPR